jgi:hypothetical protein
MNAKLILIGLVALVTLPSCMTPANQILRANADAKQHYLETTATVAQGASDEVGQYIARNIAKDADERLTMQTPAQEPVQTAYLAVH